MPVAGARLFRTSQLAGGKRGFLWTPDHAGVQRGFVVLGRYRGRPASLEDRRFPSSVGRRESGPRKWPPKAACGAGVHCTNCGDAFSLANKSDAGQRRVAVSHLFGGKFVTTFGARVPPRSTKRIAAMLTLQQGERHADSCDIKPPSPAHDAAEHKKNEHNQKTDGRQQKLNRDADQIAAAGAEQPANHRASDAGQALNKMTLCATGHL